MVDPNHPYTLHHTYTGNGCALCGKLIDDHQEKAYWLVDGKRVDQEVQEVVSLKPDGMMNGDDIQEAHPN